MARRERKTEQEIKELVAHEIRLARNYDDQELTDKRQRAINYYYGRMPDTPAEPNGSQVVSKDVAEVIGWMLPGIMRTFTASGRIVEYEPATMEDEAIAGQASDYVQYVFTKENDGYRVLYSIIHDALLQGDGVIKHWWDDTPDEKVSEHSGLDDLGIAALLQQDPTIEVLAHELDKTTGMHTVKIKRTLNNGKLVIEACKPESLLTNSDAIVLDLDGDDCRFIAQHIEATRSTLVEMGFDKAKVYQLGNTNSSVADTEEDLARDYDRSKMDDAKDDALVKLDLYECYFRSDVDGDGVAEIVRAYYAGKDTAGELLDWEVWEDEVPFTMIPCEPVPHRIDSISIADQTMDIQQIKTVLLRGLLNNTYANAHPQKEIEEGSVLNPKELMQPKHGSVIWKKKGSNPIIPHQIPFVADKLLMAIQHVDQITERRTGVSRSTMALDPDALQNQTATAVQKATDAAYSKIELIARNMAELGLKPAFRKILKLIVKHQDKPKTIRLRDEWVQVDPASWNADMDCTVNVGLGTGSRDRDMAMLNIVLMAQYQMAQAAAQYGFADVALEMLPKIVQTLIKQGEAAGIKNADDYYPDFDQERLQGMLQAASQPQEDPKLQIEREKAQIDAQAKQAALQMDAQKLQMEQAVKAEQAQNEAALARMKMDSEIVLRREQMGAEIDLKREQLAAELALKREQLAAELQIKRELGLHSADVSASAKVATSQVKMGGEAG